MAAKVEVNKSDTFTATVLCTLSQMGARWLRLRTPPTLGLATLKGDTDIEHTCVLQHSDPLSVCLTRGRQSEINVNEVNPLGGNHLGLTFRGHQVLLLRKE